jgi:hypothetical protein
VSARKLPFFQVLESKSSISRLGLSENQGVPILGMTVFRKGVTQKLGFSGKHYIGVHSVSHQTTKVNEIR